MKKIVLGTLLTLLATTFISTAQADGNIEYNCKAEVEFLNQEILNWQIKLIQATNPQKRRIAETNLSRLKYELAQLRYCQIAN
ncbi:hypothetical protein [Acinetobacter sp. Marseille-Q1618]|uniref:hypothetical protein n=1 Tax=Acinetobacter sp. Marseille-Q1618 TaxID=2697502 RepID=UPI00156F53C9|nr:hypothetical protein [Acinetobacter sp. Marseille-Q1618]